MLFNDIGNDSEARLWIVRGFYKYHYNKCIFSPISSEYVFIVSAGNLSLDFSVSEPSDIPLPVLCHRVNLQEMSHMR